MQVWVLEYADGETGGLIDVFASPAAATDTFRDEARLRFRQSINVVGDRFEAYRDEDGAYVMRQGYDYLALRPMNVVGAVDQAAIGS